MWEFAYFVISLSNPRGLDKINALAKVRTFKLAVAELPALPDVPFETWFELAVGKFGFSTEAVFSIAVDRVLNLEGRAPFLSWRNLFRTMRNKGWQYQQGTAVQLVLNRMLEASETLGELCETLSCARETGFVPIQNLVKQRILGFEPLE